MGRHTRKKKRVKIHWGRMLLSCLVLFAVIFAGILFWPLPAKAEPEIFDEDPIAEEPVPEPDANPADEAEDARKQELEQRRLVERQRQLNELEDRARAARESAAAVSAGLAEPESDAPVTTRKPLVSTKSIADVRRGFIWAKVLDEPRFKRRWSTQYR